MYLIKNFGNDIECGSIKELKEKLITNYNNNSVAIHYKKENSALTSIKFVSIKNGTVYDSYGEEKEFDFTSL